MSEFHHDDLVPLWDRPAEFLPLRPPGGAHHWAYGVVRDELERVSEQLDKASSERRVALLAHPTLSNAAATDGLHVGIQMLLPHEAADPHRHTPAALRVGLEGSDVVTIVDGDELPLGPLDVVLNPSGTWHGHVERGGTGATWLDVVDLPMVTALGGVLFEPTKPGHASGILDSLSMPPTCRFAWAEVEDELARADSIDGVRAHQYGDGSLMPTLAVSAYRLDKDASLALPARTAGAIVLAGRGSFDTSLGPIEQHDVVALRTWTPFSARSAVEGGIIFVVDTAPALRALHLYREDSTP